MVKLETPAVELGWQAKDFSLKGIDNLQYSLNDVKGKNGTIIMFICNHCPYVQTIIKATVEDLAQLKNLEVNAIAIMPNNTEDYPEDSFENMQKFALEHNFAFPYVIDQDQSTARAYGAVCTPDFFGFNSKLELQYRGTVINKITGKHELLTAMTAISQGKAPAEPQVPSIGCSIKWNK